MKLLHFIVQALISVFFSSADPNLFGSRKRRKELNSLSNKMGEQVQGIQSDINALQVENPFESAAAKSAMSEATRQARFTQNRYANMMGANASPEAMIAAQQATQEALGGAAGQIATGAEAMQQQQINQLRGEKMAMLGQQYGAKQASINQIGTGWKDFFNAAGQIGGIIGGAGKALSGIGGIVGKGKVGTAISKAGNALGGGS